MNELLRQASDWQSRLQSAEVSQQEMKQFEIWINTSQLHRQTYNDVSGFFSSIMQVAQHSQQLNEMTRLALRQGPADLPFERQTMSATLCKSRDKASTDKTSLPNCSTIAGVVIVVVGLLLNSFCQKVNNPPLIK